MEIVSLSPLPATIRPYQTARGAHLLLIVCKATFLLAPGTSTLHGSQEPIHDDDKRWDDKPDRSVFAPADIVPFKRDVDVVLVGYAFTAGAVPARSIQTRLCVGDVDKGLDAFGDRLFTPHGELREGAPITRARLRYERAAGGPGTTNPVGMRSDKKDVFGAIALPGLQPPGLHVTRPEDLAQPVGYGPIAADWPSRAGWLAPYAATFSPSRWYEAPLPDGLDPAFFNVAPADQRLREVRPDERIVLEGLTVDQPRFVTQLPGLAPRAVVERGSGHRETIHLRADTLWIDTSRRLCTVTWRASIPLAFASETGRVIVTLGSSEPSQVFTKHDAALLAMPMSDDPDGSVTFNINPNGNMQRPVLPFGEQPPPAPVALEDFPDDPNFADDDAITFVQTEDVKSNTLPFVGSQTFSSNRITSVPPPPLDRALPFAPPAVPPPMAPALPFFPRAAPPPPAPPARASSPQAPPRDLPFFSPLGSAGQPDASAFTAPRAPTPSAIFPSPSLSGPTRPEPSAPPLVPRPPAAEVKPEAPAMIGPLATAEMYARTTTPNAAVTSPRVEEASPPASPAPALPVDDFPIERCAQLTASISRRKNDRARILEAEKLEDHRFAQHQAFWTSAISAETERGKTLLLEKFDKAYVSRLEEERGVILPQEFARIVVASERGHPERALRELDLPPSALMRIERVFLGRTARDPDLALRVRHAIETERDA